LQGKEVEEVFVYHKECSFDVLAVGKLCLGQRLVGDGELRTHRTRMREVVAL
jgi:hypothetical protein